MIRLKKLGSGYAIKHKAILAMAPLLMGEAPDILRVLFYRPSFYGKPVSDIHQAVMRGESPWSVGERELFGAFVSVKNKCRFCLDGHKAVASRLLGSTGVEAILAEMPTEQVSAKAQAMLPLLEKLTLTPDAVGPADIAKVRAAGVTDRGILDGIYIVGIFTVVNRVVDAVGSQPMTPKAIDRMSKMLIEKGYGV